MRFPFLQEESGGTHGFKYCLCVKEMEMPTGHSALRELGKQEISAGQCIPRHTIPIHVPPSRGLCPGRMLARKLG